MVAAASDPLVTHAGEPGPVRGRIPGSDARVAEATAVATQRGVQGSVYTGSNNTVTGAQNRRCLRNAVPEKSAVRVPRKASDAERADRQGQRNSGAELAVSCLPRKTDATGRKGPW